MDFKIGDYVKSPSAVVPPHRYRVIGIESDPCSVAEHNGAQRVRIVAETPKGDSHPRVYCASVLRLLDV